MNRSVVNPPKSSRMFRVNSTMPFAGFASKKTKIAYSRMIAPMTEQTTRTTVATTLSARAAMPRMIAQVTPARDPSTGSAHPAVDGERAVVRQRQPAPPRPVPSALSGPRASTWSSCRVGRLRPGTSAAEASGRSPLTRAAWRGSMFRSPISTSGSRVPVERPHQPAQLDLVPPGHERQVGVGHREVPVRALQDGGDGDPRLVPDDLRPPVAAEPHRHPAGQGGQPDHPPGHHRQARQQRDAVAGRARLLLAGGRHPGAARGARQRRHELVSRRRPWPRRRPR